MCMTPCDHEQLVGPFILEICERAFQDFTLRKCENDPSYTFAPQFNQNQSLINAGFFSLA